MTKIDGWVEARLRELQKQNLHQIPLLDYGRVVTQAEFFISCGKWESLNTIFKFHNIENLKQHVKSLREELKLKHYDIAALLIKEKFGNTNKVLNEFVSENAKFSALTLLKEGKIKYYDEIVKDWLFDNLISAAENGETETVKMFCVAGAEVDRREEEYLQRTALQIAIEKGHLSTAEYLIKEAKADVNIGDKYNETALHLAAGDGHIETVKLLCESGAQVDRKHEKYFLRTPLQRASEEGHISTVEYLIKEAKADVNIADNFNDTALHLAAREGKSDIVNLLCEHGANIDGKGSEGRTALHWASICGDLSIVQCLVGRGASVNQQNDDGFTPLHDASRYGDVSIASLLLESGADAAIKNKLGKTARDVAGLYCDDEEEISEIKSLLDQYSSGQ